MSVLACRDVEVVHAGDVHALAGVDLDVEPGESLALLGRSGSGKTTLLHVLAGLVPPTRGTIERGGTTSLVFQGANLLPQFTAIENVGFAARNGVNPKRLLDLVGLDGQLDQLPGELSGGEAQRVAIARALAQEPDVLLCDEPTGHLDSDTAARVLDLIAALRDELGFALVIATHDSTVGDRCERRIALRDGKIV
ncbi:MAG: putative transport system ATP-binding protein [Gaiellaceae bacterium]|nr:putative transport system ATP-binding protein [Gaiellaceae bacterium]MDX6509875.1 putative transport system ATP-binding protein [Gaiellaceae bacterium]